jgi:hypothetical protein
MIFASSSRMVKELKDATTAIPIFGLSADPVSYGIDRFDYDRHSWRELCDVRWLIGCAGPT